MSQLSWFPRKLINCLIEGDNVEKRGAMSGGYHDKRQNRLRLQSSISAKQRELSEADEKLSEVKNKLNSIDAKMTKALEDLSGQETKQARHRYISQLSLQSLLCVTWIV